MIVYVYVCTVCVYESVCFTNVYLRRIQVDILLLTYVVCLIMRRKINIYLILSYLILSYQLKQDHLCFKIPAIFYNYTRHSVRGNY